MKIRHIYPFAVLSCLTLSLSAQDFGYFDDDFDTPEVGLRDDFGTPTPTPRAPEREIRDVQIDFGDGARRAAITRDEDTISVDFPDEDVRTIIRNVADLYELNVVIPDTLVGRVSLKLRDVTWAQVFDVILDDLGYTWIEDRNIIRIRSQDDLLAEPVVTRVFVVNFARANEVRTSIEPLVQEAVGGRIRVDTRSNSLIITERPSRMNEIQSIIDRLDEPTPQVAIESKFIEINKSDADRRGLDWRTLWDSESGASIGVVEPTRLWERDSLTGAQSRLDSAVFSASNFRIFLEALQSQTNSEVISNPTIVTLNNTPASINVGEEYPLPNYRYNQQTGTFEVSGFEYRPMGILLTVTPSVNNAGFINLDVVPEINERGADVTFNNANIPIVNTRRAQSNVTIKSGQTLAIGGLLRKSDRINERKVPIVGDIPLLGRAFRTKSANEDITDLLIFVTAKVLDVHTSTYEDVFSQERLNSAGVTERSIPSFEPSPEEQELQRQLRDERSRQETLRRKAELQLELEALNNR